MFSAIHICIHETIVRATLQGNIWTTELEVPSSGNFEFKLAVRGGDGELLTWQPGENRLVEVPANAAVLHVEIPWDGMPAIEVEQSASLGAAEADALPPAAVTLHGDQVWRIEAELGARWSWGATWPPKATVISRLMKDIMHVLRRALKAVEHLCSLRGSQCSRERRRRRPRQSEPPLGPLRRQQKRQPQSCSAT